MKASINEIKEKLQAITSNKPVVICSSGDLHIQEAIIMLGGYNPTMELEYQQFESYIAIWLPKTTTV